MNRYAVAKAKIVSDRTDFAVAQYPRCDICGRYFDAQNPPEAHHAPISRGMLRGTQEETRALGKCDPRNILLVHSGDCHGIADSHHRLCAAIQIARYGMDEMRSFVTALHMKITKGWNQGIASAEEAQEIVRQWQTR